MSAGLCQDCVFNWYVTLLDGRVLIFLLMLDRLQNINAWLFDLVKGVMHMVLIKIYLSLCL